ncbi:MAG: hypothetical protein HFE71_12490 [Emergencia sp.]|jgi:hypothetical protein|uniref:hypothetical protein n=1 Tax=Emergencia sp. JLR.KK010 TaxID=3114296 RepID=UPI0021729F0C|nr:hypothetical protein [Emergencia sp.]
MSISVKNAGGGGGGFPNGTKWSQSNITDMSIEFVDYANGIWVAGTYKKGLYYSEDGKIWTQSNLGDSYEIECMAYGNGVWVAGCIINGTILYKGLWYSEDGKTWTQSNIKSGDFLYIYYANGVWIGSYMDGGLYYSKDGKTWTQSNIKGGRFQCICEGQGVFAACNITNGYYGLYYSTDGKYWYGVSNTNNLDLRYVYYADGQWIATGYDGQFFSTDGKNWTQGESNNNISPICNANGIWIGGLGSRGGLVLSHNGKDWNNVANAPSSGGFNSTVKYIHNSNGIWICGTESYGIYYSIDGQTWMQTDITSGTFGCIENANGIWVAGSPYYYGEGTGLYYSVTWEASS